jgi:acetoacetyl-CoA synthetase
VVESTPGVTDSLVIGIELPDGGYYMPLFIVSDDTVDESALRAEVSARLSAQLSRRHVPDEIVFVAGIPRTRTGKKLEVPIKRLLQGTPADDSLSRGSIAEPEALDWFVEFGKQRVEPLLRSATPAGH